MRPWLHIMRSPDDSTQLPTCGTMLVHIFRRVREGLKVIVFEQTAEVLDKRLGFRVAAYGLRRVFPRVPDHPLLAGIGAEHLRDWRAARRTSPGGSRPAAACSPSGSTKRMRTRSCR